MNSPVAFLQTAALLRKHWLRYWYRRRLHPGLDLGKLERTTHSWLYREAAGRLGLSASSLGPVLAIRSGERSFLVDGVWTDFDTVPLCQLCGDKVVVGSILRSLGLNVPQGRAFPAAQRHEAEEYASSLPGPCVVKPARGTSSGTGVSVKVSGARAFRRAFSQAAAFSDETLVQEFVEGDHFRFLVYKGACLSAVRRDSPSVTGDGHRPVGALIRLENARRQATNGWSPGFPILLPLPTNRIARAALAEQGLSLRSVPPAGARVRVAGLTHSYAHGATYAEVLPQTHPGLIRASEQAGRALGVALAGVDIISRDCAGEEYVINEVNTTPSLEIHYFVSNPEQARDPIGTILRDAFGLAACPGTEDGPWPSFLKGETR